MTERVLRHCGNRIGGEICVLSPNHKAHCILRPIAVGYRILMAKEVARAVDLEAERRRKDEQE